MLLGLQQGSTTHVGVIGGSISHGAHASRIGITDWFSVVGHWLQTSYPQAQVGTGRCSAAAGQVLKVLVKVVVLLSNRR